MWNLKRKNKINKLIDTEDRLVVARSEGWEWVKWVKGVKRYKFPVINKSVMGI